MARRSDIVPAEHEPWQLSRLLDDAVAHRPDELALVSDGERRTFRALAEDAAHLAQALVAAGLAGERLATLLPNGIELVTCYLACWQAGVTMVPFEFVDAPPEIQTGLADCGARWLVADRKKLADLARVDRAATSIERVFLVGQGSEPAPESAWRAGAKDFRSLAAKAAATPVELSSPSPETLAFILYTSGSTALPKGVTHSHASAAGIVESVLAALARVDGSASIVAHDSVSHMGGWIEVFPLLRRGAKVVLAPEFEPARFYRDLRRWRPTVIGAHVDHLWQIVRHPGAVRADFESVDTVFTGGDELPLPLQRQFLALTGRPIEVGWGMTEAIWLTIARQPELARRGFMGRPVAGVEIRVVDPRRCVDVPRGEAGELWVRGPMVTPGYWRRPEADRAVLVDGGWLRTGDMGLCDPAGDYWFTGRLKQIIERRSENITPGEIEQALYRHPAVSEAGAFGVPDAEEGEVPIAYVTLHAGARASEAELKEFLAGQIAEFKIPLRILALERMPLTSSGKIDHKALAERFAHDVP